MGLLKHLLFWPVTGPSFLTRFSLDKVQDAAREQLTDDQFVKEELLALQMQLELGEIDDDQYVEREAELMQRLRDVRHWREQFGMGTSGGPVQVAREREPDVEPEAEAEPAVEPGAEGPVPEGEGEGRRGGIASPQGAEIEFRLDWEE